MSGDLPEVEATIDFAAINVQVIQRITTGLNALEEQRCADDYQAERVSALCSTCGGDGEIEIEEPVQPGDLENVTRGPWLASLIDCPDCPTVGGMLQAHATIIRTAARLGTTVEHLTAIGAKVLRDDWAVDPPDELGERQYAAFDMGVDATLAALRQP